MNPINMCICGGSWNICSISHEKLFPGRLPDTWSNKCAIELIWVTWIFVFRMYWMHCSLVLWLCISHAQNFPWSDPEVLGMSHVSYRWQVCIQKWGSSYESQAAVRPLSASVSEAADGVLKCTSSLRHLKVYKWLFWRPRNTKDKICLAAAIWLVLLNGAVNFIVAGVSWATLRLSSACFR